MLHRTNSGSGSSNSITGSRQWKLSVPGKMVIAFCVSKANSYSLMLKSPPKHWTSGLMTV